MVDTWWLLISIQVFGITVFCIVFVSPAMPSAVLTGQAATHCVQLWMCERSPVSEDGVVEDCLSQAECRLADRLRSRERRWSFAVSRWLGKQAVQPFLQTREQGPRRVEILSEDSTATTSRPVIWVNGALSGLKISVTHADHTVAVAVTSPEHRIGIDLARIQPASQGFTEVWMSDQERSQVTHSDDPALTATMNWSSREATFKSAGIDDRFRPAHWSVTFDGDSAACFHQGQRQPVQLSFYRVRNDLLLTVAGDTDDIIFHSL